MPRLARAPQSSRLNNEEANLKRFLSLDWDHRQLHLVSAKIGKNSVQLERAVVFSEQQTPNVAEAEALGKQLRARLKEAGIAPAPVLACLGRDRLTLKEIRFPAVPEAEEPAIVRFQALKELSEPPDEVIIDYVVAGNGSGNGERRALALIARKELVAAYQAVCKTAGLKLIGLVPRPYGTLACAEQIAGATGPLAVMAVAEGWADFCVGHNDDLFLARTLTPARTLAGEVRRSLALYSAQSPQQRAGSLYIADGENAPVLRQGLEDTLGIGVHTFDPLAGHAGLVMPQAGHGGFAPAVGLLHRYSQAQPLPINFVKPKQPRAARDPHRRMYVMAGVAAAALLIAVVGYCLVQLAIRDREIDGLYVKLKDTKTVLEARQEDAKRIKALDDWNKADIVWLDELYDLTSLWPEGSTMRLTQLNADPVIRGAKDTHVAKLDLKGITVAQPEPINELMDRLNLESSYQLPPKNVRRNTSYQRFEYPMQFEIHVDLAKRDPDKYVRQIAPPEERGRFGPRGGMPDFGFGEGGQP
jgi:Tfp pilus assembly PilM family ATPase